MNSYREHSRCIQEHIGNGVDSVTQIVASHLCSILDHVEAKGDNHVYAIEHARLEPKQHRPTNNQKGRMIETKNLTSY